MAELSYLLRVLLQDGKVLLQLVQPPVGVFAGRRDCTGQDRNRGSQDVHSPRGREGRPELAGGNRARSGADPPHSTPRNRQQEGPGLSGASLTLWLQLGEDGLGPADGGRREGLHALLGCVADGLDVGVALLGGGVGRGHHVAGGADEGHAGHAVDHAGLRGQAAQRAGPAARGALPFQATAPHTLVLHPGGRTRHGFEVAPRALLTP